MAMMVRTTGRAKTGRVKSSGWSGPFGAGAKFAILIVLGLSASACSVQQEVVRMPELTGLPIQPIPLPPPATVMTVSQKEAAIAQMQAAGKKNIQLAN